MVDLVSLLLLECTCQSDQVSHPQLSRGLPQTACESVAQGIAMLCIGGSEVYGTLYSKVGGEYVLWLQQGTPLSLLVSGVSWHVP